MNRQDPTLRGRGQASQAAPLSEQETPAAAAPPKEAPPTHAPYNFVPFCETPLRRYANAAELPAHDRQDPALLSGSIRVTLTAETPLLVAGAREADDPKRSAEFYRGADGRYQIPGSTLRGLLRSNMQTLGFGLIRPDEDLQDRHLFYRIVGKSSRSGFGELKKYYNDLLQVRTQKSGGGSFAEPCAVQAGYLYCEWDDGDGKEKYYIRPVKPALRVPRRMKHGRSPGELFANAYAQVQTVWYKAEGQKVLALEKEEKPGYKKGDLLCVGYMHKQKTLYLFRHEPPEGGGEDINLSPEEVRDFQIDYEARKNQLGGTKASPEHWALPQAGSCKPVFYLHNGEGRGGGVTRAGGTENYNNTVFGFAHFLRVPYAAPLSDGLPAEHRKQRETADRFLDYPSALLGYATKKGSYRSRVSVGPLYAQSAPDPVAKGIPVVLAEPKPTFFAGYVQPKPNGDPEEPPQAQHYNKKGFRLRGIKQYWLKPAERPEKTGKDTVSTTLRPLPAGTVFSGTLRYRNLHPDELGLLLWCLRLDPGCRQNLGLGKPYGYGRVRIELELAESPAPPARLHGFAPPEEKTAGPARVEALIHAYEEKAGELLRQQYPQKKSKPLRKMSSIAALLAMKRFVHSEENAAWAQYMKLEDDAYKKGEPLQGAVKHIKNLE